MAQRAFDHWWNTLADSAYAERCHRKNKLRQRKSRIDKYQVNEDVWARHPTNGFMYIASVIAVNSSQETCRVTFVLDGRTFTLPLSHLRHLTYEDIQCNRYVDYEHGWTERTKYGTIITCDRYGEVQQVQYGSLQDILNCTDDENDFINNDNVDSTAEEKDCSHTLKREPIWVRIPDPEDPSATFSTCPIWGASSYVEAEKQALELVNQDTDYKEAVQRAQSRMETLQQLVSSHVEELRSLQSHEHMVHGDAQTLIADSTSQHTESSTPIEQLSPSLAEQQLSSENMGDNALQASKEVPVPNSKELVSVKECGTQTESPISSPMGHVEQQHEETVLTSQGHETPTIDTKETCSAYTPRKHPYVSRFRSHKSLIYAVTEIVPLLVLALVICSQLLVESPLSRKNNSFETIPRIYKISIGTVYNSAMIFLAANVLSPISKLSGPSRSLFELWFHSFSVP